MCLWVLAHRVHPRYPLLFAGNRDEFHRRPAAPADWWPGLPIVAGRDLEAGGTWLGLNRAGRFAVITNFRDMDTPRGARPTRGELVPAWLLGSDGAGAHLGRLRSEARRYAGFNLLFGDAQAMHYLSNRGHEASPLAPGVYALANGPLDSDSPKVRRVRDGFSAMLENETIEPAALLTLLADRRPAEQLDAEDELELRLSAPFVLHPDYGTRCSTVLSIDAAGTVALLEQSFDADGRISGESNVRFSAAASDAG